MHRGRRSPFLGEGILRQQMNYPTCGAKSRLTIVATLSLFARTVHDKLHYKKRDALDTLDTTHERGRERTS
jgi:hypothetical protein